MSEWKEYRIKEICDFVSRGTTPDYVDNSPYKVMNQATFSKGLLDLNNIRYTSKVDRGAQIRKRDLLMASTGGGVLGKVFYFDCDDDSFYADSHVSILRNSKGENLMKYLYYLFSIKFEEINATMVKGSTNQTELQKNYLLAYEINMPSLQEQQRIVDYLDKKLATIDNRVEVLKKEKDAYARFKKSVIHQAVTRGLNPNVTLKDSGIEWIGMIPDHWELRRIKDVVSVNKDCLGEDTDEAYKFRYIDIGNVSSEGEITLSDELYFYDAPSRARRIVRKGDVIVSTVRTYLRAIARIDFEARDIIASTGFAVLSPKKCMCSSYLAYVIRSSCIIDSICAQSTGVSYPAISSSNLSAIDILFPPLSEQQEIANYLDEKCAKIDAAIENITKQIDASKRLRKAIINEAISG